MDYEGNAKKRKRSPSPSTAGNTSSSSASGGEFEVFLSFCGKDTCHTFTNFLYTSLVGAGIRTFRNENELRVGKEIGPQILKAINKSKISIPILSKNYASSEWCLRELAQMLECQETMGQKIFPIFFDVEPSDVRRQTGSFEQAFRNHKKRFDGTIVQGWEEAMRKVGELMGWQSKKETNGSEGELAKKVTTKVLIELKGNYMDVIENLVGIEDQVKEMMELLNVSSDAVQIVGIVGMGGIGKTTIAKVIYNQIFELFEGVVFLADVRERSQQYKGLVDLQNELCSMVLKRKHLVNITNVDEGLNLIKNRVCRKKVLIVLDDVDEKSQFDKLIGNRDWFARGSRIIVTTRDKNVLHLLGVDSIYEPPPMKSNHSLQLFSRHAFRMDFPPEDYDILSKRFVNIVAGLPLAIEIIGSYLFGKEKSNWPTVLERLEKIPENNLQNKLKISYDALDYEQKQMFLDIACFFIGEDKRVASYMWDNCKFYPAHGLDALVLKCLVKIRHGNVLWMHDQLRDLGRHIICAENFGKPWKRSRVWTLEDALETMKRCKETQKDEKAFSVEALRMEFYFPFPKEFGLLKNLRYLHMDTESEYLGDKAYVDLKRLFPKLRWLKWHGFLSHNGVTDFHLINLVILDLSRSSFKDSWESWKLIKTATNLKVLNLTSCCGLNEIPDFSTFGALEILILKNCCDLVKIDSSIGNLTSLRVLDFSKSSITELPDAIGNLEKLEEIYTSECYQLRGEFPDIRRLSSLRILNLNDTMIYSLPRSICELTRLQTLDLRAMLESLPELPSSLTSLHATCTSIKTFPSLSKLKSLKELDLFNCFDLMEIPRDIKKLSKLEILNLGQTSISILPAEMGDLPRLKILRIHSENLQCIQGLPSSLFKLSIFGNKSIERLTDLSNLKNMSTLHIDGCSKLMQIHGLGKLESLMSLTVKSCEKLAKLDGLEKLESLRYLSTSCCKSLQRLPDLSNLGMLEVLDLSDCRKLVELKGFSLLKSLEVLDVSYCTSLLLDLSNLSNLKKLKELKKFGCELNAITGE